MAFRMGRLIVFSAVLLFIARCAPGPEFGRVPAEAGAPEPEQDAFAYVDPGSQNVRLVSEALQDSLCRRSDRAWKAVWKPGRRPVSRAEAEWGFRRFGKPGWTGENRLDRPEGWLTALEEKTGLAAWPNRGDFAVTQRRADLRLLPTDKPAFENFQSPGGRYPFDMIQQSAIPPGTPLRVIHASVDGDWLYVESPVAAGWIRFSDAAMVDAAFIWQWNTGRTAAVLADDVPVRTADGRHRFRAPFGTVLPLLRRSGQGLHVLVPVTDGDGIASAGEALLSAETAAERPVPLTAGRLAAAVNAMMGQAYGWGGLYGNRDCSAALQDLFAPFGILLPRHSSAQAAAGDSVMDLSRMTPERKERVVLRHGIPFLTLIHLKGHIMLYVGPSGGRACVFHNLWAVRTVDARGAEGRHIVGRSVITTLTPGQRVRNADPAADLLKRVDRMTFIVHPDSVAGPFRRLVPDGE
ncbi:SH3 domain-containing protein [bacterium]|nr:SH3 domain-containing protein [bacterium]